MGVGVSKVCTSRFRVSGRGVPDGREWRGEGGREVQVEAAPDAEECNPGYCFVQGVVLDFWSMSEAEKPPGLSTESRAALDRAKAAVADAHGRHTILQATAAGLLAEVYQKQDRIEALKRAGLGLMADLTDDGYTFRRDLRSEESGLSGTRRDLVAVVRTMIDLERAASAIVSSVEEVAVSDDPASRAIRRRQTQMRMANERLVEDVKVIE